MKFKTLLEICCVLVFELDFNVENKKLYCLEKKKPHQPIQPKPHWFGLVWFGFYFKSQPNRAEPNYMFYLAVRMTFNLKIKPNCTANTPSLQCDFQPFLPTIFHILT